MSEDKLLPPKMNTDETLEFLGLLLDLYKAIVFTGENKPLIKQTEDTISELITNLTNLAKGK